MQARESVLDIGYCDCNSPTNDLRLQKDIERAFDKYRLTFVANHDQNLIIKILEGDKPDIQRYRWTLAPTPKRTIHFNASLTTILAHINAREKWLD